jgi:hypothetical protein
LNNILRVLWWKSIFLNDFKPLEFSNDLIPFLFRCPEDAAYILIILQAEASDNIGAIQVNRNTEEKLLKANFPFKDLTLYIIEFDYQHEK